jgi:hypothetical protein
MTTVASANSTAAFIRTKIRRLTASVSESALSTASIDEYINNFYSQDFPYAIKLDQMRSVYTFYTQPYIDRYPLDVNYNQGIRAPIYVEGIEGFFFKDREQFFNMWPRWPTKFNPINGDGVTTAFTFTIPGPFLSKEVVLGGVDSSGNAISVADDGNGNLQLQVPNPVVTVPPYTDVYTIGNAPVPALIGKPIPGMHNQNTLNPGLNYTGTQTTPFTNSIGSVNYVTGAFSINFPVAPGSGTQITLWVSQYQTGRPYSLLFWNNEFTIRPVPKLIHKVEVETYLTPVQFMDSTDSPILNQWAQYIAYGASMEILRDRQDMEGVENLREGFMRQEALVLERQGVEEIGQRNSTIFASSTVQQGWNQGFGQGWY